MWPVVFPTADFSNSSMKWVFFKLRLVFKLKVILDFLEDVECWWNSVELKEGNWTKFIYPLIAWFVFVVPHDAYQLLDVTFLSAKMNYIAGWARQWYWYVATRRLYCIVWVECGAFQWWQGPLTMHTHSRIYLPVRFTNPESVAPSLCVMECQWLSDLIILGHAQYTFCNIEWNVMMSRSLS